MRSISFKNPNSDPSKWLTGKELAAVYAAMVEKYDIISIEDPFDQVSLSPSTRDSPSRGSLHASAHLVSPPSLRTTGRRGATLPRRPRSRSSATT